MISMILAGECGLSDGRRGMGWAWASLIWVERWKGHIVDDNKEAKNKRICRCLRWTTRLTLTERRYLGPDKGHQVIRNGRREGGYIQPRQLDVVA